MLFENTNLSQDSIYKSKIIVRINIDEIQQTVQSFIWMIVYQKKKKKKKQKFKVVFHKTPSTHESRWHTFIQNLGKNINYYKIDVL